jgi:hypothetical protein
MQIGYRAYHEGLWKTAGTAPFILNFTARYYKWSASRIGRITASIHEYELG